MFDSNIKIYGMIFSILCIHITQRLYNKNIDHSLVSTFKHGIILFYFCIEHGIKYSTIFYFNEI